MRKTWVPEAAAIAAIPRHNQLQSTLFMCFPFRGDCMVWVFS